MATIPTQRRGENADADTADGFLGGRLTLRQPARGHRFGSDAALLAACAPTDCDGEIMDVGAGVGAVGLAA
ncbi:MAG: methyltransferase, partial [Hyphomicrobiales bacterium]|nr:methyltransferase [Hyphomicrobiales bacterium]